MRKQGGNLVSYFCTPDGRILNFVVGAVAPDAVLQAADWALEQHRAAGGADHAADFVSAHGNAHLAALSPEFREAFAGFRANVDLPSPPPIDKLVKLAVEGQAKAMAPRFAHLSDPRFESIRNNLARGSIAGSLPHLILSQRPLARIEDVDQVIFESLAGEAFNPYGRRNALLANQVKKNIDDRVPTLLVIEPQIDPDLLPGDAQIASSLPTSLSVKRHLESMRVVSLSNDELTWLLADLGQPTIAVRRGTVIQFVVLDAQGERLAALKEKTPTSVLARFMAKAVASAPTR